MNVNLSRMPKNLTKFRSWLECAVIGFFVTTVTFVGSGK
jgi:hypothetical protein